MVAIITSDNKNITAINQIMDLLFLFLLGLERVVSRDRQEPQEVVEIAERLA
ncbi:hypothetical protein D3C76_1526230 [compost metagenome]